MLITCRSWCRIWKVVTATNRGNENYKIEKVLGLDLTETSGLILSNLSNGLSYNIESSVIDISGKNAVCHDKKLLSSVENH